MAGLGSIAIAGAAAAHTMTIQLPDGTVEQIHYAGDVAPRISLRPAAPVAFDEAPFAAFDPSPIFARMEQISAAMDREMATLLRAAQSWTVAPNGAPDQPIAIDAGNLPPGAKAYSFSMTISPNGVCRQSMEITSQGPNAKPQVVSHSAGSCGAPTNAAVPDEAPAIAPAERGGTITAKAVRERPATEVQQASLERF
jgi:hypothetical protein